MRHLLIFNNNQKHWLPYLDSYLYIIAIALDTDIVGQSVCLQPFEKGLHIKSGIFLFSLLKNTHKIYIKMRNTQENWIIIAKHGNHFLTALHNELVTKIRISMIETLGAVSRTENFNLTCEECVAYVVHICFCVQVAR